MSESFGTRFYRFQQKVGGVPVLDVGAVVTIAPTPSGDLVVDNSVAGLQAQAPPSVGQGNALSTALSSTRTRTLRAPSRTALAILPTDQDGRLVWHVRLASQSPFG